MPVDLRVRPVLYLTAAAACWGIGTVLSKQVLDRDVEPLTLLAIELAASCTLLLTIALARRSRWTLTRSTAKLTALGVLNPGLAYALGLWGLTYISASMSVLLWALEPVFIVALAVFVLRQEVARATVVAIAAAVVGVILIAYRPGLDVDPRGIVLTLLAVLSCAIYTVLTQRLMLDDASEVVVICQQAAALAFAGILAAAAVTSGLTPQGLPAVPATWLLAAGSGVVYYGLAFTFFVAGLREVPASTAGTFLPLVPVFGLAAAFVAGDRLLTQQWLGALLVILAAVAAVVRTR
ncbi:DMT family transporter [Aeromicrobium sp. CTD01-1L150]|uniref:DMT family transporter n=1 Tax=Aeromicrobium sp. CTD01-1L150 TaxID=3341830 RepID=UPI0035C12EA6